MPLTEAHRIVIVTMKQLNKANAEIIKHLHQTEGISVERRTVQRVWARYRQRGDVQRQGGQGRKAQSQIAVRHICRIAKRNRWMSLKSLAGEINGSLPNPVTKETVRRTLAKSGLSRKLAAQKPMLNSRQRSRRLAFAKEHGREQRTDWRQVIFSDEKIFRAGNNRRGALVTRKSNERYSPHCLAVSPNTRRKYTSGVLLGGKELGP